MCTDSTQRGLRQQTGGRLDGFLLWYKPHLLVCIVDSSQNTTFSKLLSKLLNANSYLSFFSACVKSFGFELDLL